MSNTLKNIYRSFDCFRKSFKTLRHVGYVVFDFLKAADYRHGFSKPFEKGIHFVRFLMQFLPMEVPNCNCNLAVTISVGIR